MVIEAVAIDGPGASGKTTVGARVAGRLRFRFLDTGLTYRAATWAALRRGVNMEDDEALAVMTRSLDIRITEASRVPVDGVDATDDLNTGEVDRNVSRVSAVRGVRVALVPIQRRAAGGRADSDGWPGHLHGGTAGREDKGVPGRIA